MLAEYLPEGHENAVSRPELSRRSGLCDRHVRKCIEQENLTGELILNNGEGYFLYGGPGDDADFDAYIRSEMARARSIVLKCETMKARRREVRRQK